MLGSQNGSAKYQFKNEVKSSIGYPGADVENDHYFAMMKCILREMYSHSRQNEKS